MKKRNFKTKKTARYFTLGNLDENTTTIYFALHGYAQTADDFLNSLSNLFNENTFIVAPEALSRFYWKDFSSKPVASWMTKLEREDDINDNIEYLNKLYLQIIKKVNLKNATINYIGFSQGTATLSRWLYSDLIKADNVFFYAGDLAKELELIKSKNFKNATIHYIYGNNDFFITENNIKELINLFKLNKINLKVYSFKGSHKISEEALKYIKTQVK